MARGFTLVEILVVLSLSALIASVSLTDGIGMYERDLSRNDQTIVLGALREARAESMNGLCRTVACRAPSAHGVFISQDSLTIFEGPDYANRLSTFDQIIPFYGRENFYPDSSSIVFAAGSGDVATTTTLTLTKNGGDSETITINSEGGISLQKSL